MNKNPRGGGEGNQPLPAKSIGADDLYFIFYTA